MSYHIKIKINRALQNQNNSMIMLEERNKMDFTKQLLSIHANALQSYTIRILKNDQKMLNQGNHSKICERT